MGLDDTLNYELVVSIRFLAKGLRQLYTFITTTSIYQFLFAFSRRVFVNYGNKPKSNIYNYSFYSLSREGSSSTRYRHEV